MRSDHARLLGRESERRALEELLMAGRGTLVLRGEAGIGKSALLEYARQAAGGRRISTAVGVESEAELAFAGVHQLCLPLLDALPLLAAPQRAALETAFGISVGAPPDRFLVGLAVLGLLEAAARREPLLCLVDDAQWLDRASAQTLAFVGRRVRTEPVVMVFATREDRDDELAALPSSRLRGLSGDDARRLLASALPGRLDHDVIDRFVSETRGNPLAILELPRDAGAEQLAGGFPVPPDSATLTGAIEEQFRRRVQRLPPPTRELLLVGAAEPLGDPALLWGAGGRLGIGAGAEAPAERDGLLELGRRVRFRHPLVRSAIYRGATADERRRVHAALAAVTDPDADPDRRAWHRAQAAVGPDESVALELERSAGRARARGGIAAAAAFMERAATLTLDPAQRVDRVLAAALAKHEAGASEAALALLAGVQGASLDERQAAQMELLRARIAFARDRDDDAPVLLLRAARRLESLDVTRARETYLEALSAAQFAGGSLTAVAEAAHAAAPPTGNPRVADLFLDGLSSRFTQGYAAAAPTLAHALERFRYGDVSEDERLRWLWLACRVAVDLWDDESWSELAARDGALAHDAGALGVLQLATTQRVSIETLSGNLAAAESLQEEVRGLADMTGSRVPPYGDLLLAALTGREHEGRATIDAVADETSTRGEALAVTASWWATGVLGNGLGDHERALAGAKRAGPRSQDLGFSHWSLAEWIEAAVRLGRLEEIAYPLERLGVMARATATDWVRGIDARSRALAATGAPAEQAYREAIDRLGRTRMRVDLARAHLLYGEWLRRERRRIDARAQLRLAHERLAAMGVEAFAERAARELRATGESARRRVPETSGQLTAQERQVAVLARDGLSNPEIGARLFISRRTVEYHLSKVFAKLGIVSRVQLPEALPDDDGD